MPLSYVNSTLPLRPSTHASSSRKPSLALQRRCSFSPPMFGLGICLLAFLGFSCCVLSLQRGRQRPCLFHLGSWEPSICPPHSGNSGAVFAADTLLIKPIITPDLVLHSEMVSPWQLSKVYILWITLTAKPAPPSVASFLGKLWEALCTSSSSSLSLLSGSRHFLGAPGWLGW